MKYTHRSYILDALLKKKVRIVFKDGRVEEGILLFKVGRKDDPWFIKPQSYYLRKQDCDIGFPKTIVKSIEKL